VYSQGYIGVSDCALIAWMPYCGNIRLCRHAKQKLLINTSDTVSEVFMPVNSLYVCESRLMISADAKSLQDSVKCRIVTKRNVDCKG
jgi:hypothetical protein